MNTYALIYIYAKKGNVDLSSPSPFVRCQCWPEKHNKQMRVKCQNHCQTAQNGKWECGKAENGKRKPGPEGKPGAETAKER